MFKNEDGAGDGRGATINVAAEDKQSSHQASLSLLAANCTFSVNFVPANQTRLADRPSGKTDNPSAALTTPTKASPTKGVTRRRRSSFELPLVGSCPACGYEVGQVLSQILRSAACGALQQPTQRQYSVKDIKRARQYFGFGTSDGHNDTEEGKDGDRHSDDDNVRPIIETNGVTDNFNVGNEAPDDQTPTNQICRSVTNDIGNSRPSRPPVAVIPSSDNGNGDVSHNSRNNEDGGGDGRRGGDHVRNRINGGASEKVSAVESGAEDLDEEMDKGGEGSGGNRQTVSSSCSARPDEVFMTRGSRRSVARRGRRFMNSISGARREINCADDNGRPASPINPQAVLRSEAERTGDNLMCEATVGVNDIIRESGVVPLRLPPHEDINNSEIEDCCSSVTDEIEDSELGDNPDCQINSIIVDEIAPAPQQAPSTAISSPHRHHRRHDPRSSQTPPPKFAADFERGGHRRPQRSEGGDECPNIIIDEEGAGVRRERNYQSELERREVRLSPSEKATVSVRARGREFSSDRNRQRINKSPRSDGAADWGLAIGGGSCRLRKLSPDSFFSTSSVDDNEGGSDRRAGRPREQTIRGRRSRDLTSDDNLLKAAKKKRRSSDIPLLSDDCDSADDSCRDPNPNNDDKPRGPRRLVAAAPINASSGSRSLGGTLSLQFSESSNKARRHHIRQRSAWSNEEEKLFIDLVNAHGTGQWAAIHRVMRSANFHRDPVQLKDKFRNLQHYIQKMSNGNYIITTPLERRSRPGKGSINRMLQQ